MTPAVEVAGLSHTFGAARVLRDVDLRVEAGERVAVFGPNGAGKSTLLRVLATLIRPSAGMVRVLGLDPRRELLAVRRRIGVVGHRTYLDDQLTAAENLRYYGRLYDVAGLEGRIAELLELVGLRRRADDRVRVFSRGMQQRLALARALLHDPDLLLLDEPDTGLDAQGVELLAQAVDRAGRTVVLTSHHPERAMQIAGRAVTIVDGRIVSDVVAASASGPLEGLSPPGPLSRARERGNLNGGDGTEDGAAEADEAGSSAGAGTDATARMGVGRERTSNSRFSDEAPAALA